MVMFHDVAANQGSCSA